MSMKRPRVPEFSRLSWRDVDPARREFDPAAVPALVRSLPPVAELDEVAPILTTVRRADDAEGAAGLARMVHGIAAASGRRWRRARAAVSAGAPPHGPRRSGPTTSARTGRSAC